MSVISHWWTLAFQQYWNLSFKWKMLIYTANAGSIFPHTIIWSQYLKNGITMLAIIIKPYLHLLWHCIQEASNSKENIIMWTENYDLSDLCAWASCRTWVWSIGEGLGVMWSTSIGHHEDSHRNWRSDWLVVERRDCHYQMVLKNRDPKGQSHF